MHDRFKLKFSQEPVAIFKSDDSLPTQVDCHNKAFSTRLTVNEVLKWEKIKGCFVGSNWRSVFQSAKRLRQIIEGIKKATA